jgi:hypothetical protein
MAQVDDVPSGNRCAQLASRPGFSNKAPGRGSRPSNCVTDSPRPPYFLRTPCSGFPSRMHGTPLRGSSVPPHPIPVPIGVTFG